jgi:hypothetical protein
VRKLREAARLHCCLITLVTLLRLSLLIASLKPTTKHEVNTQSSDRPETCMPSWLHKCVGLGWTKGVPRIAQSLTHTTGLICICIRIHCHLYKFSTGYPHPFLCGSSYLPPLKIKKCPAKFQSSSIHSRQADRARGASLQIEGSRLPQGSGVLCCVTRGYCLWKALLKVAVAR